ncbi:hypothetical protein [Chloroflexus sp.]|uniref:hypothetical protein n=1 Tax=Chloroflexus sp. TaxID=1904827 RepID=UPI00260917FA|nr:hypothetical protein [uncultured Chloroflexus sp.]
MFYVPDGVPPLITGSLARLERALPQPGEILVRQGGRVEPDDVIARGLRPNPPYVINLARALSLPPTMAARAVVAPIGQPINAGAVLARRRGLPGRRVISPVNGILHAVDPATGYAFIRPEPQQITLTAGIRGVVMEIIDNQRVVIETPAAQLYGICGFGPDCNGVTRLLTFDPDEPITAEMVDAQSIYSVIIGGKGISAAALRKAVEHQVRGIIIGSIAERELRAFFQWAKRIPWKIGSRNWQWAGQTDSPITIVLTEGIGNAPMAAPLFELLANNDRREVFIESNTSLRQPHRRPQIIIPLSRSSTTALEPPRPPLRPGALVRLLDHDHLGQTGRVRNLPPLPYRLPSGVRAAAVEVLLNTGEAIWLPRSCIEVLA